MIRYAFQPLSSLFFLRLRPPPRSTLFPYTTLFRSRRLPAREPAVERDPLRTADDGRTGADLPVQRRGCGGSRRRDRKSTRLNSSHLGISYAVFCLKKKKQTSLHFKCIYSSFRRSVV